MTHKEMADKLRAIIARNEDGDILYRYTWEYAELTAVIEALDPPPPPLLDEPEET